VLCGKCEPIWTHAGLPCIHLQDTQAIESPFAPASTRPFSFTFTEASESEPLRCTDSVKSQPPASSKDTATQAGCAAAAVGDPMQCWQLLSPEDDTSTSYHTAAGAGAGNLTSRAQHSRAAGQAAAGGCSKESGAASTCVQWGAMPPQAATCVNQNVMLCEGQCDLVSHSTGGHVSIALRWELSGSENACWRTAAPRQTSLVVVLHGAEAAVQVH
jgi:hypothetical protein